MDSFDSLPADDSSAQAAPAAAPTSFDAIPSQQAAPSFDALPTTEEQYGGTGQQVLAAVEGASKGFAGPVATLAEKGLSKLGIGGLTPQDQEAREEANPWTHGLSETAGFGLGAFTGTGEAALLAKAGELATGAMTAGKVLTGATKMAAEMALMGTGDEITKYINDAPQSVGSVLSNIGLTAALGGVTGGVFSGLGKLGKAGIASVPEGLSEFTDRLKYRMTGAEPHEALHSELSNVLDTLDNLNDETYGASGVKSQSIAKLVPEMGPKIQTQIADFGDKLTDQFAKMDAEPDKYPNRLVRDLKEDFLGWKAVTNDAGSTSEDIFNATNKLKQKLGAYSQFEKRLNPLSPELSFVQKARDLGTQLKNGLEDSKVWGDAADVQKKFNAAYSEIQTFHKQIKKAFTGQIGDEVKVLPEKVMSYLKNGVKDTHVSARQERLGGFMDKFNNYQKTMADIAEKAGIENPVPPVGTGAIAESLEKPSPWAHLADTWYDHALTDTGAKLLGGSAGAYLGEKSGVPGGAFAGAMIGGSLGKSLIPSVLQPLLEKAVNAEAFQKSISFAENMIKGEKKINGAIGNVFKAGVQPNMHYLLPDDKKLDKLQAQVDKVNSQPQQLADNTSHLSYYMPNHGNEAMGVAGKSAQYLQSIKPKAVQPTPLDSKIEPTKVQLKEYRDQLSIAEQPLQVIQKIKDGTLTPTDIRTLGAVSPGLQSRISKGLYESLTEHTANGGTVPYSMRQSLSLFLGQPLDSTMTPTAIMAAQGTFAPSAPPQQQGNANGKGKGQASKLGKSNNSYKTANQEAESDRSDRQ